MEVQRAQEGLNKVKQEKGEENPGQGGSVAEMSLETVQSMMVDSERAQEESLGAPIQTLVRLNQTLTRLDQRMAGRLAEAEAQDGEEPIPSAASVGEEGYVDVVMREADGDGSTFGTGQSLQSFAFPDLGGGAVLEGHGTATTLAEQLARDRDALGSGEAEDTTTQGTEEQLPPPWKKEE